MTASATPPTARPETGGSVRKPGENPMDDETRTPGDGTLPGSIPAGLTVHELTERATRADQPFTDGGTG